MQKAVAPLSGAWLEARTLVAAVDSGPDPEEARVRLRAVLPRVIDAIGIMVTKRGRDRLAAVQVFVRSGDQLRLFEIRDRPSQGNKAARQPGRWWARSARFSITAGTVDLQTPEGAALTLGMLKALTRDQLEESAEWDRAGDLMRSRVVSQADDPGRRGFPGGRPATPKATR
jgi:hypothetical protein